MKKAHLCSDVLRELYVEPPPEANEPQDIVWRLQRVMYGTRDAAAAWEREWTKTLNSVGFKSGVSNPALLHCETLDASMVVHGDDYNEALSEVERAMSDHYTIKVRAILGAGWDVVSKCEVTRNQPSHSVVATVKCAANWIRREIHAFRFWHVC